MNAYAGNASMPSMTNANSTAPSMTNTATGGGKKTSTTKKVLLGRERVVTKEGRSCYVVINGKKETLTVAKQMDAEWRKEKKAKEAAKKAKEAAKKARKTKK